MYRNLALAAAVFMLSAVTAHASQISGDYVETRSANVYTGPCIANGEVGLKGNEATLAWRVRQGGWNGVRLEGLSVVAVAKAGATLGDPYENPWPAEALLIVDERANPAQQEALVSFARSMAGRLLENIVRVQSAPITMKVGEGSRHGQIDLKAGDLATVRTRPLSDKDHFCGNESTYYPPLTKLSHSMPVFTISNEFQGSGLNAEWHQFDRPSAFVGTFSR